MATTASHYFFRWPCMAAGIAVLASCQPAGHGLQEARDAIAATLPAPYFEDLVTESATIEGNALVLLVRSPEGNAAKTREHPEFEFLQQSEQDEMRGLCALAAIRPLASTDAVLVRRFVDRDDGVFFEVRLPARECAAPATNDASAPPPTATQP